MKINFLFFTLALCFVYPQSSFCQINKQARLDSLRQKLTADSARIYRFKKITPLFALDSRNSFIHNSTTKIPVDFGGFQLGFVVHERHSMGIGLYYTSRIQKPNPIKDERNKLVNINFSMAYLTTFYEYQVLETKRWEIGIPVEIGVGNYQITTTDSIGKPIPGYKDSPRRGILLFGTGINVDFKIFKWIGLNVMQGFRIVGGNEPNKINLNGIFYSFGLHIYFGEIIKTYRLGKKRRTYRCEVAKTRKL